MNDDLRERTVALLVAIVTQIARAKRARETALSERFRHSIGEYIEGLVAFRGTVERVLRGLCRAECAPRALAIYASLLTDMEREVERQTEHTGQLLRDARLERNTSAPAALIALVLLVAGAVVAYGVVGS